MRPNIRTIERYMKAKDLRRILASKGCSEIRQKGSQLRVECGSCVTTIRFMRLKILDQDYCAGSNEISSRVWEEDG